MGGISDVDLSLSQSDQPNKITGNTLNFQGPLKEYEIIEQELNCILGDEFKKISEEVKQEEDNSHVEDDENEKKLGELYQKVHTLNKDGKPLTALCLSGGGIRSATFCLGVFQALARKGQLGDFHYLSTVSGGGYIGSWLSRWISLKGLGSVLQNIAQDKPEPTAVSNLRSYSNYLAPHGLFSADTWSLVVLYLRNLFLNWLILWPLLIALLLLPHINLGVFREAVGAITNKNNEFGYYCFISGIIILSFTIFLIAKSLPIAGKWRIDNAFLQSSCPLFMTLAAWLLALAYCFFISETNTNPMVAATFAVPFFLLSYFVVGTLWIGATAIFRMSTEADREWLASSNGRALAIAAGWVILHSIVFYLPSYVLKLGGYGAMILAGTGGLSGIITTLYGYWSKITSISSAGNKVQIGGRLGKWGLRFGALLFIILIPGIGGSLLVEKLLTEIDIYKGSKAVQKKDGTSDDYTNKVKKLQEKIKDLNKKNVPSDETLKKEMPNVLNRVKIEEFQRLVREKLTETDSVKKNAFYNLDQSLTSLKESYLNPSGKQGTLWIVLITWLSLVVWVMVFSILFGVNRFSLHSVYTNRLVRAYLGASVRQRHPDLLSGFDENDNLYMSQLSGGKRNVNKGQPVRLFHVVNTTLNLVGGARLEWQQRKGSSFTVSPLHAGSWMLGYQEVDKYGGNEGTSLGKAMGISGAAMSPNMGYHSSGLIAFLLTFFNVRLGWWMPNPSSSGKEVWRKKEPGFGILPIIQEGLGKTTDKSKFVYLSDGGHFDNLGLYEMVRRRCARILLIDASADPDYLYENLAMTIRRIRTDFGIRVEFPDSSGPARQLPPKGPYTIGWIHYSDVDGQNVKDGILIYVKPVLTGNEPIDLEGYVREHSKNGDRFPHQSTIDQSFDEAQFESYRVLGEHMTTFMMNEVGNIQTFKRVGLLAVTAQEIASKQNTIAQLDNEARTGKGFFSSAGGAMEKLTRTGSIGSALESIQSWGGAMVLGTALTIGGIVGVCGTVALRDNQVTLKKPDWAIKLDNGASKMKIEPPESFEQLQESIKKLNISLGSISYLIGYDPTGNGTTGDHSQLATEIIGLTGAINSLSGKLSNGKTDNKELERIKNEIIIIKNQLDNFTKKEKDFDWLERAIENLKGKVELVGPRKNIKAGGGGR